MDNEALVLGASPLSKKERKICPSCRVQQEQICYSLVFFSVTTAQHSDESTLHLGAISWCLFEMESAEKSFLQFRYNQPELNKKGDSTIESGNKFSSVTISPS